MAKATTENTHDEDAVSSASPSSSSSSSSSSSCCSRMGSEVAEFCRRAPMFKITDGERTIDVPASFSPQGFPVLAWKVMALAIHIVGVVTAIFKFDSWVFIGYFTHWCAIIATLYITLSLYNSLIPVPQPSVDPQSASLEAVSTRTKITWILFAASSSLQIGLSITYWAILYSGAAVDVATVVNHGVLAVVVLIDGMGVNTIPVHMRHWFEVMLPIMVAYTFWTFLHSPLALGLGNPSRNADDDTFEDDDLLYDAIDWDGSLTGTVILCTINIVVISPASYLLVWSISSGRRRWLSKDTEAEVDSEVEDVNAVPIYDHDGDEPMFARAV